MLLLTHQRFSLSLSYFSFHIKTVLKWLWSSASITCVIFNSSFHPTIMSNRPSVVAGCSPSGALTTTPHSAGFFEPLNPHDNSHNYPSLSVQDSSGYAWPSSTAAQPISPVTLSDLHRQRPMMTYFGEVGTGLIRDPLITTPETPRQSPGYMLPNSDVDTRLHNLGGMGYPTLLSNGPIKSPIGTQCGSRCAHQPVTSLGRSESGNSPLQDRYPTPPSSLPSFHTTFFA